MNFAIRKTDIDDSPGERLFCGFRLRDVSLIVLTGFIFTLLLCAWGDVIHDLRDHHHEASASTFPAAGHSEHNRGVQQAGECCTVLASVTTPPHVTDFSSANFRLLGILLFSFVALEILSTPGIKQQFNCTGPPNGCKPTLIANCLWPNAPPR